MRAGIVASISVGLVVLLLVGFVAFGSKPVPQGEWRGMRARAITPGTDPLIADQLQRVILKIGEGGKADLEDGGMPFEGQVSWDGDRLEFLVLTKLGINMDKQPSDLPRRFFFQVEGKVLVFEDARLEKIK